MRLVMRFNQLPDVDYDIKTVEIWLEKGMTEMLEIIEKKLCVEPQDKIGLTFSNTRFVKSDFYISFRRFDQYDAEFVFSMLSRVLQSNSEFSDTLVIYADHIRMPVGLGRCYRLAGTSFTQYVEDHPRTIFNPKLAPEHNTMCLAEALVKLMSMV